MNKTRNATKRYNYKRRKKNEQAQLNKTLSVSQQTRKETKKIN